jgi:hypothetical protein
MRFAMTVRRKTAKKNAVKPKARKAPLGEYAAIAISPARWSGALNAACWPRPPVRRLSSAGVSGGNRTWRGEEGNDAIDPELPKGFVHRNSLEALVMALSEES